MIHAEAWCCEADEQLKEFEGLRRVKLDAMEAYVRELSRNGKLKLLPKGQLVGLAHFGVLRGMDLRNMNLSGVDFSKADLRGVDFRGADLQGTHFYGADLREANFQWADLRDALVSGAEIQGANFRGAHLDGIKADHYQRRLLEEPGE